MLETTTTTTTPAQTKKEEKEKAKKPRNSGRWRTKELPLSGWVCVDSQVLPRGQAVRCQMCHGNKVRFAYRMAHPDDGTELLVGSDCALRMSDKPDVIRDATIKMRATDRAESARIRDAAAAHRRAEVGLTDSERVAKDMEMARSWSQTDDDQDKRFRWLRAPWRTTRHGNIDYRTDGLHITVFLERHSDNRWRYCLAEDRDGGGKVFSRCTYESQDEAKMGAYNAHVMYISQVRAERIAKRVATGRPTTPSPSPKEPTQPPISEKTTTDVPNAVPADQGGDSDDADIIVADAYVDDAYVDDIFLDADETGDTNNNDDYGGHVDDDVAAVDEVAGEADAEFDPDCVAAWSGEGEAEGEAEADTPATTNVDSAGEFHEDDYWPPAKSEPVTSIAPVSEANTSQAGGVLLGSAGKTFTLSSVTLRGPDGEQLSLSFGDVPITLAATAPSPPVATVVDDTVRTAWMSHGWSPDGVGLRRRCEHGAVVRISPSRYQCDRWEWRLFGHARLRDYAPSEEYRTIAEAKLAAYEWVHPQQ